MFFTLLFKHIVIFYCQGYGDNKPKSSTVPQEVKPLNGIYIHRVACGYGHALMIARVDTDEEKERVEKLPTYGGP